MANDNTEKERIAKLLKEFFEKRSNLLRKGTALTAGGVGAMISAKIEGLPKTYRVKAGTRIDANSQILVAFFLDDEAAIAVSLNSHNPRDLIRIERSEKERPPKSKDKKETAIVPILVSKTVGEEMEEPPKCTCTHYAIGKVYGSRAFSYETCDGTVPGASKDKQALEQEWGLSKVYYWCFNSWNINSSIPWLFSVPVCEEPPIPRNPDLEIYGSRAQRFKLNPFQPFLEPSTPLYSASNMYLIQTGPINQYFTNGYNPQTQDLFLYPEVQDNIWGFHLVADEQPIVTATGKKFSIKPTTLTSIPVLTPPITAIANARAWKHGSAFGGVVRLVSNEEFNTDGWFVAFGEPVDRWYDENDNPVADGMGVKREIGVVLRSFGYWNRVPWQLVVDPDTCPQNPLLEQILNEPPKEPEESNKYLMTKWFVGGITEQWLELPIKHRVDDPHYALISCNSEKRKIWVSIKTGLDPLNTFEEKTEWFEDIEATFDVSTTNAEWPHPGRINNKIGLGKIDSVKDNYLTPSDVVTDYLSLNSIPAENVITSNKRIQFSNQGARFCKIKLISINVEENGNLIIDNIEEYKYESRSLVANNPDNWNHVEMTSFLAYFGSNYMITPDNITDYRYPAKFGQKQLGFFFSGNYTEDLFSNLEPETLSFPEKNTPFISGLTSFFGIFNHSYFPSISQKQIPSESWDNYKQSIFGKQNQRVIASHGLFAKIGSILLFNTDHNFTVFSLENPILFGATHIMGVSWKKNLIEQSPSEHIEENDLRMKKNFFLKKVGIINHFKSFYFRSISYTRRISIFNTKYCYLWPFWGKENLEKILRGSEVFSETKLLELDTEAREKASAFIEKQVSLQQEQAGVDFYAKSIFFVNLDKQKMCCFDFYRGYGFKGTADEGYPPSIYNKLAFSTKPIECPVYVCEFDGNDDLKNYNIYANPIANAVVYPFDYTEGEPCSFTVWGAAPALMKLKKT